MPKTRLLGGKQELGGGGGGGEGVPKTRLFGENLGKVFLRETDTPMYMLSIYNIFNGKL